MSNIDKFERALKDAVNPPVRAEALNDLIRALLPDDLPRAEALIAELMALAGVGDGPGFSVQARALNQLGRVAYYRSDYANALEKAQQALTAALDSGDKRAQGGALSILGVAQLRLGDLAAALASHMQQLELCPQLNVPMCEVTALNQISVVHVHMGHMDDAIRLQKRVVALLEGTDHPRELSLALGNLCQWSLMVGRAEEALGYGQRALDIVQGLGDMARGLAHHHLATAHMALGHDAESEANFHIAIRYAQAAGNRTLFKDATDKLADLRVVQGRYREATDLLHQALRIAEAIGEDYAVMYQHQALVEVYQQRRDYASALFHQQRYQALRESLWQRERETELQRLVVTFRTEAAQRDATHYQDQLAMVEQLRAQDRRSFEQLSQLKDEMVSMTSHDLKNPLASISMMTHMLRQHGRTDDEKGERLLSGIDARVTQMNQLISDLLDLDALQAGTGLQLDLCAVNTLLEKAAALYRTESLLRGLVLQVQPLADDLSLWVDAARLNQALRNLLDNALKFTPAGGTVRLGAEQSDGTLCLWVADDGPGISADDQARVFDRYFRDESQRRADTQSGAPGSGLGLAMVKSIIEAHGGRVSIHSAADQGTIVKLHIPA